MVSAALCVAMAIMVFSFRVSLENWLNGVVGADLYVRSSDGETGFFTIEEQQRVSRLPEVRSIETLRYDRLALVSRLPRAGSNARLRSRISQCDFHGIRCDRNRGR